MIEKCELCGADAIRVERERQVQVEGYSLASDAGYKRQELLWAAVAYILFNIYAWSGRCQGFWPWEMKHFKPDHKDTRRNLVKAGALIAAEIDRLDDIKRKMQMSELRVEDCDEELTKSGFDDAARRSEFVVGPFAQDGSGYGMPYIPASELKVFGMLKDGRKVWAWRHPSERQS